MRSLRTVLSMLLATSLLPCLWAERASAQAALGTNVVAAALALPVDIRVNGRETHIVVTNAGPALTLHVLLISDDWSGDDFNCYVTQNETTLFEFFRDPFTDQPMLRYECTNPLTFEQEVAQTPVDIEQGIMFVTLENPPGFTVSSNQIFGDATVIDFDQGVAYSFEAIPFAGFLNDGDRRYFFDGTEYGEFPARLATNFIAPTQSPPPAGLDEITAELVLFTLDGTIGSGFGPRVLLSVTFFNDDEQRFSSSYSFDCFSIVRLDDIDPRFLASALGSTTGHLVLTPQVTTHGDLAHDVLFGNGNGARRTAAHGWLVQTAAAGSQIGSSSLFLANDPGWGRALARSITNLVPEQGPPVDSRPVLNALCGLAPCP